MTFKTATMLYLLFVRNNALIICSTISAIAAAAHEYCGIEWISAIGSAITATMLLPTILVGIALFTQEETTIKEWLTR